MTVASRPLIVYSCHRPQQALGVSQMLAINPVDVYCLGDDAYLEQVFGASNKPYYGQYSDSVSWPEGTPTLVTIGAAVNGVLPTGAVTINTAGTNYPAAGPVGGLSGTTVSCFFTGNGGTLLASGRVTTNASRQVVSATVDFGGEGYTNTGAAQFTLVASCHRAYWPIKFAHQKAGKDWADFYAARQAGAFRLFGVPDDHEVISNWTAATNDLTSRNAGGSPWWESGVGADSLLSYWRTARAGMALIRSQYYSAPNTPAITNTAIPSGLAGATGVTAADFDILYQHQDYAADMTPVTGSTGAVLRVIQCDSLTFKSPYNATDNGTGTTGKTMLGFQQVAWLLDKTREAKTLGLSVVWMFSKDVLNIDNGDSWRGTGGGALGYNGELNYLLGRIEAENLPVVGIIGGDRHQPHTGLFSPATGNPTTVLAICPCPYGADPAGLTNYVENMWVNRDVDAACFGTIRLLPDAVQFQIIDAYNGTEMWAAEVPFGSRVPRTYRAVNQARQTPLSPFSPNYVHHGTWANRPDPALVPAFARMFITDVGPGGSEWRTDGTYWSPLNPVVLFREAGRLGAPIATLTGTTGAAFKTPGNLPAGMVVKPGMRLEAKANFARTTAVGTASLSQQIGGQNVTVIIISGVANQHARHDANLYVVNSTNQLTENWNSPQGQNANSFVDRTIDFNNSQALAYTLGSANASDTFQLLSYSLTLHP